MTLLDKLTVSSAERIPFEIEGEKLFFPKEVPYLAIAKSYEHDGELDIRIVFAKLVIYTAEDEAGNKCFAPDDWKVLLEKGKRSIAPLFAFIGDLYLNVDDKVEASVQELEKNP